MGVPGLYRWLVTNWRSNRGIIMDANVSNPKLIDYVFIDANGPLHNVCQFAFWYGEYEKLPDVLEGYSYEERMRIAFDMFFEKLMHITSLVRPTKVLYIAIDGTAPIAKQTQQRERRMAKSSGHVPAEGFSSNYITPGTSFMFELTKYMNFKIRKEMSVNPRFDKIEVIFSPPTVPGEGEHKCMDYIRSLAAESKTENVKGKFCFVGPDGDLIMLTLATHMYEVYLLREDTDKYGTHKWKLIDMKRIRSEIANIMKQNSRSEVSQFLLADDFIVCGFFIGNDFLPRVKAFQKLDNGLQEMLSVYGYQVQKSAFLTRRQNDVSKIRPDNLLDYISKLASREKEWIYSQKDSVFTSDKFIDQTLLSHISSEGKFDFEGWSAAYYKKAGVNTYNEKRQMCISYMRCFQWVFEYYLNGLPSWELFYPYHYAPLLTDIASFRRDIIQAMQEKFVMGAPSLPFVQLLTVMPSRHSHLLPKPLRWLMTDSSSPLVQADTYPTEYEVDYEGKEKEHMGVPLLPFADVSLIRKVYEKYSQDLRLVYERNKIGSDSHFIYDPDYISYYKSPYGIVFHNKIRKQ